MREKLEKVAVKLNGEDNVATAVRLLPQGTEIADFHEIIILASEIPAGHKFAVRDITRGGDIIKYGQVIGGASADIGKGDWVHTHNVEGRRGRGDLKSGN